MATAHERGASKKRIMKKHASWRTMKPEKTRRVAPGATSQGRYFHIQVRPRSQFETFRTQDVGGKGGIQRVAGRRATGSWADQKWLISKEDAHIVRDRLVPDTAAARKILDALGSTPVHIEGDRFRAKPKPNVPERSKPIAKQRRAQSKNIKKAQQARRPR